MFKHFLVSLLILCSTAAIAQKKVFSTAVFAGFTASQVQGDGLAGFDKPGLTAGLAVKANLNRSWGLGFELAFVQKGSRKVQNPDIDDYTYYRLSLNYAEVPLLLHYSSKKLNFSAGPTIAYLLGSHEETSSGINEIQNPFRKIEIGVTGGVAYRFTKKMDVSMRIQESITSIRNTPDYAKGFLGRYSGQYNTVLNLTLIYNFL